jgi:hypothetical protein
VGTPNISINQLILWAALLGGLLVAAMLGSAVGSSDMRLVAAVLGLIPVIVLLANLKTNIWVLIPIGWYLDGRLLALPLPLTVRDICMLIVIGFYTGFFAMRVMPWKRQRSLLDNFILLNLAYLAIVYFRNPVGFFAFQSTMVGGRPYFEVGMAFAAYLILSRVRLSELVARIFPWFMVIPNVAVGLAEILSRLVPAFGQIASSVYTGIGGGTGIGGMPAEEQRLGETRFTGLLGSGVIGVQALCARYSPITLISPFHPVRTLLFAAALAAIFLSGFRSAILFAMVAFLLSAVLRRQTRDLWLASAVAAIGLILLVTLQGSVIQLPITMQRSLSWLPGDWNEEAVRDAQGSTEWRLDMWKWAWEDTRIMRDKVWGQGFGFTLDDMNLIANALLAGQSGGAFLGGSYQESFMIMGSFHSGPLSTIKVLGVVGLLLYYPLMVYMAVLAWRLCRRAYGTKSFTLALFIGIPIIYEPFNFVFIFGGIDSNYPRMLFWAGLLNMLSNHLGAAPEPKMADASPGKRGLSARSHPGAFPRHLPQPDPRTARTPAR